MLLIWGEAKRAEVTKIYVDARRSGGISYATWKFEVEIPRAMDERTLKPAAAAEDGYRVLNQRPRFDDVGKFLAQPFYVRRGVYHLRTGSRAAGKQDQYFC